MWSAQVEIYQLSLHVNRTSVECAQRRQVRRGCGRGADIARTYSEIIVITEIAPSIANSPLERNNRGACASYQSTNVRDRHRSASESSCSDSAHCCPSRIHRTSAVGAPGAECCSIGWAEIRSSSRKSAREIRRAPGGSAACSFEWRAVLLWCLSPKCFAVITLRI